VFDISDNCNFIVYTIKPWKQVFGLIEMTFKRTWGAGTQLCRHVVAYLLSGLGIILIGVSLSAAQTLPVYTDSSSISLENPPAVIRPGDVLVFSVRIMNTGNRADVQLTVTDTLDNRLTFVEFIDTDGTVDSTGVAGGTVLSYYFNAVPPGSDFTRKFKVRVRDENMPDNTVIHAKITLESNNVSTLEFDTSFTVESLPSIVLTKSISDNVAVPGDTLEHKVIYENMGTDIATLLVVTDGAPDNTTYVSGSVTVDGVAKTDSADDDIVHIQFNGFSYDVIVNVGTVSPGGHGVISFKSVVN